MARKQYNSIVSITGGRGRIYDAKDRILATNITSYSVYADPQIVTDKEHTARILAEELSLDKDDVLEKLNRSRRFVWIKRQIPWPEKEAVEEHNLPGVGLRRKIKRFYPQKTIAAHVLGMVDIDNQGLEGIELKYDEVLRGKEGFIQRFKDSAARGLIFLPESLTPQEGADVYLTLDGQIQYWAEKYLAETIDKFGAKGGSVVVLDTQSGGVLALVNFPDFNPNKPGSSQASERKNQALTDMFEPGSVFKIVTLIAALNEGAFNEDDMFFCENGEYKIPGTVLHDYHPYGNLSFREVFSKSSNIGVAKIAQSLGKNTLYRYIKKLQFAKATGIDLPGEINGFMKEPNQWSKTSGYIVPIGQEVGVTLIQLAQAMSIIVSEGELIQPYVVKKVVHEHYTNEIPPIKKNVLSPRVCERAKAVLIDVVENGTGRSAWIEGALVGGKTGTAQKFDVSIRRYSPNKYRASFVGFIEKEDISLVIAISIDEPRKSHLGGTVAAPLFGMIGKETLRYLRYQNSSSRLQ
ncbi:MAG: penicillin-binding protein 2 [Candidatus Omnitrophica bacterium]|nr:penicillin-binding protein 2 [Candidatus Omnitrophota bacterium]